MSVELVVTEMIYIDPDFWHFNRDDSEILDDEGDLFFVHFFFSFLDDESKNSKNNAVRGDRGVAS